MNYSFETNCLRIEQPFGHFYVASIPARILLDTAYSDRLKAILQDDGSYRLLGSQRLLVEPRLREIAKYVDKGSAAFPNSIILAANYREEDGLIEEEDDAMWRVEETSIAGVATLKIPQPRKVGAIIDGQHRLFSFNYTKLPERLDMPLLCAIYFDLPKPYQAFLFATINSTQKSVSKSQTYELFGYNIEDESPDKWTPEKLAVFLARKLNVETDSAFYQHILIPAENDFAPTAADLKITGSWAVSTATVVEGITKLITSNPRDDAYDMAGSVKYEGRDRSILKINQDYRRTPLRDLFIKKNDDLIYSAVKNFFNAVEEILWREAASGSYITKTVGVQALFDVLKTILPDAIESTDIRVKYFLNVMYPCGALDFSDNFFQASGTGKQRIRNSLEICLKLKTIEQMREEDQDDYSRICTN